MDSAFAEPRSARFQSLKTWPLLTEQKGKDCHDQDKQVQGIVLGSFLAPEIDMRRSWAPLVLDTFHSTLHTVHSTFIQRFTLFLCTEHSTLHFTPNLHSSLHLHSTLYTLHTPNSTLLTPHFYTPHSHSSLCKSQHLVGRIPCTGVIAWWRRAKSRSNSRSTRELNGDEHLSGIWEDPESRVRCLSSPSHRLCFTLCFTFYFVSLFHFAAWHCHC